MELKTLPNHKIDKKRWHHLNEGSNITCAIYNSPAYLDVMASGWEAIVINNYETALALPFKKKMGLKVYGMPPFVQKMAIIGHQSEEHIRAIQEALFKNKLVHLAFDKPYFPDFEYKKRNNYCIDLRSGYENILHNYRPNCKNILNKAKKNNLRVEVLEDFKITLKAFKKTYGAVSRYKEGQFDVLTHFLLQHPEKYTCYGVLTQDNQIAYSAIILQDTHRYYYLMSGADKDFRDLNATYFFIDWFLNRHAGQDKTFDFEGSDIPSVAFFFQRFGPVSEPYYNYFVNNHIFPIKQILDQKLKY